MPPKNNKKSQESTVRDQFVAYSKMNKYRRGDVYSDIDFRVQGKSFKCHRQVLGAASKYFHAMFTGKFKESTEFVVTLEEIEVDTFEGVLQFIYTGEVVINPTNVYGLFYASEYYDLPGLEKACVEYIGEYDFTSTLVENVPQMYSFFSATKKEVVADILDQYIFDHFDNFYRTPEFLKISIDDLRRILEKMNYNCVATNHDIFHKAIMRWTFYADSHSLEEKRKFSDELIENIDFSQLSGQYLKYITGQCLKYITGQCIEYSNVVKSTTKIDGIAHSEFGEKSLAKPCLHAFAHNSYFKSTDDRYIFSEVYSCYEEHRRDAEWVNCYSFGPYRRLPNFMRTVDMNNYLYCLSYTEHQRSTKKPIPNFITTSSISLIPKSYLTSPPLELENFEMCRIHGNIYVYNKNAQSKVVRNVENSAKFDEEALSRAVYLYNTEVDTWLPVPPLKQKFANACMTSDERMLYLIGGTNSNKYVQGHDYRTPEWIALAPTSGIYERAACCVSEAELFVSGGCQNPKKVESYNPIAAKWSSENDMIEELYDHEILLNEDGECITYNKLIVPDRHNVFPLDPDCYWLTGIMYNDLEKRSCYVYSPKVIHMTLFTPYGF